MTYDESSLVIYVAGNKYQQDAIKEHVCFLADARCHEKSKGEKTEDLEIFSRWNLLNIEYRDIPQSPPLNSFNSLSHRNFWKVPSRPWKLGRYGKYMNTVLFHILSVLNVQMSKFLRVSHTFWSSYFLNLQNANNRDTTWVFKKAARIYLKATWEMSRQSYEIIG